MAVTRHYLSTSLNGISDYDMPTAPPSPTSLVSSNVNNTAFQTCLEANFLMPAGATIDSSSVPCVVDVASISGTIEMRWRLVVRDIFGVLESSSYSSVYTTTGSHSQTLTFNPTLAPTNYYGIEVEIRRTAGHGNVSVSLNIPQTVIDPDYSLPVGPADEWWIIS